MASKVFLLVHLLVSYITINKKIIFLFTIFVFELINEVNMVLVEFAMFPTDKGESVSQYVSQVIDYIDKSGIDYTLTPMGTILEGTWEEVMRVIDGCFKVLESQANRIYSTIKIDYRKGREKGMKSKTQKIQSLLNRDINKV